MGDPLNRTSLAEVTPPEWRRMGLHPVGRLDADTTGLLLFSSDGKLTQRLLHPKNEISREYEARVEGDASDPTLAERLAAGVETSEGTFPAMLLEQSEERVRLSVTEGKYRMVRRILANCGHPVTALHRVRYGEVRLGELGIGEGEHTSELPEAVAEWARAEALAANGGAKKPKRAKPPKK